MQSGALDDKAATAKIDRQNMLRILEETPEAYEQAYTAALKSNTLPHTPARSPAHLALVGMGGSAIAGDILKAWLFESPTTIEIIRGSRLPGSITASTYVLVTSYSGQTAETLKALKEARRRKSRVSCIASEGELLKICRKGKIPHVEVRRGLQPREALPHLLSASLVTLERWGVCSHRNVRAELRTVAEQLLELRKTIGFARRQSENPAKQLAVQLQDTIPFIYAPQPLAAAGRRFKNQLNENSKVLAKFEVIPEMLHNEVQGWRMLKEGRFADSVSFVLLRGCETEDEADQFDRLTRLIREGGGKGVYEMSVNSRTRLACILATIYYCDYVSFYLAISRGVDPTPIDTIQLLKGPPQFPSD
jgi:glucose/mannose-6-phosphate isomerase